MAQFRFGTCWRGTVAGGELAFSPLGLVYLSTSFPMACAAAFFRRSAAQRPRSRLCGARSKRRPRSRGSIVKDHYLAGNFPSARLSCLQACGQQENGLADDFSSGNESFAATLFRKGREKGWGTPAPSIDPVCSPV